MFFRVEKFKHKEYIESMQMYFNSYETILELIPFF